MLAQWWHILIALFMAGYYVAAFDTGDGDALLCTHYLITLSRKFHPSSAIDSLYP